MLHQHLSEWLLHHNGKSFTRRDPGFVACCWRSEIIRYGYERPGQSCKCLQSAASYMSLLCVCAQLTLQTGHQPLVRVVRHQTHQLQPPLDLRADINHKMLQNQNQQNRPTVSSARLTNLKQDEGSSHEWHVSSSHTHIFLLNRHNPGERYKSKT